MITKVISLNLLGNMNMLLKSWQSIQKLNWQSKQEIEMLSPNMFFHRGLFLMLPSILFLLALLHKVG